MTKLRSGLVLVTVALATSSSALAQAPAAPAAAPAASPAPAAAPTGGAVPAAMPAPKPAPELEQLKFLMGKWRCDGKAYASMFWPEHTFKAVAEGKADLDGFWDAFSYEEKKSKQHRGLKVHGVWGWDAGNKRLVRAAGSNDGSWDSATSPGMQADKIVWTGELSNGMAKLDFHHTFTKKTDKEWTHFLEVKDPSGKWTPIEEVDCKR